MNDKRQKSDKTLGRDPFEGMEWPPKLDQEEAAAEPGIKTRAAEGAGLVGRLRGKGVWLLYSRDVDLAIEMALAIGATHVLYKTGHRGMFFVEAARRVHDRARAAGLIPFAWPYVHCDDPIAEAEVAIKSARVGYEGIIFDIEDQTSGQSVGAAALGRQVLEAGLDPARLYYTSYPNIWQHLDIPYKEMNAFCHGGFMPQCYPTFQRTPRTVIKKWAYGEHARWSEEWGNMPPLYPILAAYKDEHATQRLSAQEFLEWAQTLAAREPPFFSVYRAGTTDRELWPILAAMGGRPPAPPPQPAPSAAEPTPPPEEALSPRPERPPAPQPEQPEPEQPPVVPTAVYHEVTVNDTVWGIRQRHGIARAQFWEWNGHLWDELGMPRDALYMQEGWRVRVG